jgi:hypothetical protein
MQANGWQSMQFAEAFLHNTSSYPLDQNGTPWGRHGIAIDFLGGPYVFDGLNPVQIGVVSQRFAELVRDTAEISTQAIHTHIFKLPETCFKTIDTRNWEYYLDFDYRKDHLRIAGLRFVAYIQLNPHIEAWMWTPDDEHLVSNSAFENIFRVIVAYRLLARGGMVLHSAGLAQDNGAWLLIGRSGAGKSTISRLGEKAGMTILSDDMNAIVLQDDSYVTEQLPFAGEHGQTALTRGKFPVQAIHYLQKSSTNELENTPASKRLAELMVCSPFINTDPYRYADLAQNLAALREKVSGGHLKFRLDGGFQQLLKR